MFWTNSIPAIARAALAIGDGNSISFLAASMSFLDGRCCRMKNDNRLILGLGGSKHDYAACLLKDGELLVAIEEERVTRAKRGFGCDIRNARCIDYCLDAVGASLS